MTETNTNASEPQEPGTDIIALVEHDPSLVLLDKPSREKLYEHIEKEVEEFVPDLTTAKGRDEIKAFAFKITRTKTAVENARLAMTENAREQIKAVNAEGSIIKERLEGLAKTARAPLTEWEEAEDKRQAECKAALERMRQAAIVPLNATADGLRARIVEVEAEPMHEDHWLGMKELALKARDTALEALNAALAIVEQKEKDAAELVRLREEAAAREAQAEREREEREAAAAEQARAEQAKKAEAEERRVAAAAEEARLAEVRKEESRVAAESAAQAAAEAATREAAQQAAEQADARQRAHEAELAAANEAAAERERVIAEEAAEARRQHAAAEERERQRVAAEQATEGERARLAADQDRRTEAKRAAKEALMTCGADEETAKKIVIAIIAQEIPRVVLDFSMEPVVRKAEPIKEGAML